MFIEKVAKKLSVMTAVSLAVVAFTLNGSIISASTVKINDNFNNLSLKPNADANWWIIQWGGDNTTPTPSQGRWEGLTGSASSTELIHGDSNFLRTSLFPQSTPGFFNNVDVSELHTGFPWEGTGHWTPTVGHPVTLTSRVRWGNNFGVDGSGAARGTSGVWLWNSPFDFSNFNINTPMKGIGFNWMSNTSLFGILGGLKANVIDDNNPVYIARPTQLANMTDWMNLKFVWSVDAAGVQSVTYYINDENVGTAQLPQPFTNLSVEIWNDNEDPQFTATGLVINYANPTERQDFDVTSIKVTQD